MGKKGALIKNIGIEGVTAPQKTCDDENCPFHGSLRVRGILIEGKLIRYRAQKSGVVEREYLAYDVKYKRYERRKSKLHVHIPPCLDVKEGDNVLIAECRPIAKSISFVVIGKR